MKKKVLVIGWDAADWEIIRPLMAQGKLPALKKLIDKGVSGNLSTMNPPYSPMLWTSVATGKTPDKHGVLGFIELDVDKQQVRPVTVTQRKVKALWNILHNQGLKSNLVGWWPSHPAEPINGVVVSDQFNKVTASPDKPWPVTKGSVHPESLAEELKDLRVHPSELTAAHLLPFIPNAAKIEGDDKKSLEMFAKIMADNVSTHACSTWLMENTEWDFMGIYFDMIDHFCHGFMKYHPPKLDKVPQDLYDMYNGVINAAYMFQDMMLERTLDLAGEDTLVIVMSDHGYVSDQSRMLVTPKDVKAAPALEHREFGIFIASGPGIKSNEQIFGTSLLDITPTILQYFGIPVGKDMDGSVMNDLFETPKAIKYIDSWETQKGDFAVHKDIKMGDALSEQAAMEQLIELGYIDRPDSNMEVAINETRCDLKFNLARVYIGKGDLKEAKKILKELMTEDVETSSFLIDLLQIAITENNYKEARKYLNQLRKTKPESILRTRLTEAKILIGEAKIPQAEKILLKLTEQLQISGAAYYELGKLYLNQFKFESALTQLSEAIKIKSDSAKYHQAIAVCYLRLNKLEDALTHGLKSVELVRYFPDAHYTIGEILEKMGDLENAKSAYETAEKLSPTMNRPKLAKENIEKITEDFTSNENTSLYPEIIIVSGLPRSGTSMMMQMLNSGGLEALTDGKRKEDIDNPKGYFEYEKTKSLHKSNDWLSDAEGKSIKIIAQLLKHLPTNYRYKVIFMTRDIEEVITSQSIMLKNHNRQPKKDVQEAYENELTKVDAWSKKEPGVEIIKISYAEVVKNPKIEAEKIALFLNKELDIDKMVNQVQTKLYRNKVLKFN